MPLLTIFALRLTSIPGWIPNASSAFYDLFVGLEPRTRAATKCSEHKKPLRGMARRGFGRRSRSDALRSAVGFNETFLDEITFNEAQTSFCIALYFRAFPS
jgi:hypothetical protein